MKTITEMKKNFIKKDFIVDNLMKSKGLYCLVARPKVGKSLLALQFANSIATGTTFLGFNTNPSPVLYISTEMDSIQLVDRIIKMDLQLDDDNFFLIEQEPGQRKLNLLDLQLEFQEFALEKNGKFVIIDMFSGIDTNSNYDLSNYQDMGQVVLPKFRELCQKYGLTMLLVHHLNKSNSTLGSTAIDGSVDGIITLKQDVNIKNKIIFNYESRDYEGQDFILKRNDNLTFEISKLECEDLHPYLIMFLNYAIRKIEFDFTYSQITSALNITMSPSVFGKLLSNNIDNLEKEGLHITKSRGKERMYHAKYEEPIVENE